VRFIWQKSRVYNEFNGGDLLFVIETSVERSDMERNRFFKANKHDSQNQK
jgi:hypothetical protein